MRAATIAGSDNITRQPGDLRPAGSTTGTSGALPAGGSVIRPADDTAGPGLIRHAAQVQRSTAGSGGFERLTEGLVDAEHPGHPRYGQDAVQPGTAHDQSQLGTRLLSLSEPADEYVQAGGVAEFSARHVHH